MKKIVVIEDDADVQEIYFDILSKRKYRIFPAITTDIGLRLIETEHPDLIILDMIMSNAYGKFNGMELLDYLHNHPSFSRIPVFVISNLSYQKDKLEKIGAADYLNKSKTSLDVFLRKVAYLTSSPNEKGDQ